MSALVPEVSVEEIKSTEVMDYTTGGPQDHFNSQIQTPLVDDPQILSPRSQGSTLSDISDSDMSNSLDHHYEELSLDSSKKVFSTINGMDIAWSSYAFDESSSSRMPSTPREQPKWEMEERTDYRGKAIQRYVKDGLGNTFSQRNASNIYQCTANVLTANGRKKRCRATVIVIKEQGKSDIFRRRTQHESHLPSSRSVNSLYI